MDRLTKRSVEKLEVSDRDYFVWDSELSGFGVRVMPFGRKSYLVQYRASGRSRRRTIGLHGVLTADQARVEAKKLLGDVARGGDQMRISRVDFAVDILAPWFVPDVDSVILPARTTKREFREKDTSQRFFANTEVTGITCGHVSNRQMVIYDKRAEVLSKKKLGWVTIWNETRARDGLPPIDLEDRNTSRVWRFENRVGSKCLRRRWLIKSFEDLDAMIGDVFEESLTKMRYAEPQTDGNRARRPDHEMWALLPSVVENNLSDYRSGVIPSEVRDVNRSEHMRMTDQTSWVT